MDRQASLNVCSGGRRDNCRLPCRLWHQPISYIAERSPDAPSRQSRGLRRCLCILILPKLASVLQAASAIIWREFLTKRRQTGAAERQATLGDTQSTDALPRITAAPKPLPPTPAPNQPAAQPQSERAEPTPRAYARQPSARRATQEERRSTAISEKKEKRR